MLIRPAPTKQDNVPDKKLSNQQANWKIPAERMKMNRVHVVPLARQALELLEELRKITGAGEWLFPTSAAQPM